MGNAPSDVVDRQQGQTELGASVFAGSDASSSLPLDLHDDVDFAGLPEDQQKIERFWGFERLF
jgi:hypothetical protein